MGFFTVEYRTFGHSVDTAQTLMIPSPPTMNMTLTIEVPILIDEELSAKEVERFREYVTNTVERIAQINFAPGPRLFAEYCKFGFAEPTITVDEMVVKP